MTILLITIAYIIGIIMGLYIKNIAFFLALFLLSIFFLYLKIGKNKFCINNSRVILFFLLLLIGFLYTYNFEKSLNNKYKDLINDEEVYNLKIEAIVVSNCKEKDYSQIYTIKVLSINNDSKYNDTYLLLYLKNKKQHLQYGDKISFLGKYEEATTRRNYGGFDYKQYLKTKKIFGLISTKGIESVEKNKYNNLLILINQINSKITINANKILNKDEASLLTGILIGNKENLDEEIQENFRNSNLSHLLAVSGAHVSFILIGIVTLFSKLKVNKRISKASIILFLLFFIILTGATPSVERACIMAIYLLFAQLIHKKPNILSSICLSLLIILFINPYRIFDIGLQLSYGGTIGIILFNRYFDSINKNTSNKKIINRSILLIKNMFVVSVSANIIIFPIIAYHYNTFSLTFFISNIIVGPFLGIIIFLGFVVILISFISLKISKILCVILSLFLKLLIMLTKFCSFLPFSKIYVKTPSILIIILYYFLLLIFIKKKNLFKNIFNRKTITIVIIVLLVFQVVSYIPKDLRIYFVDVGQGDCSLILTPNNKSILIDGGGSNNEKYDVGKKVVIPYLLDRGITKLDYIIISHFDTDHVGGILTVLEEIKVNKVIISNQIIISENYKRFTNIVKEKNIDVVIVNKDDQLIIDKDIYLDILWPGSKTIVLENPLNNNSLVCKISYKNFSILFTGDIEEIAESKILAEYKNNQEILNSKVLKVGHHGSITSSSVDFLNAIKPNIALIGVGENNKFGHPNNEIIQRLKESKTKIYRTDKNGEISITVNKKGEIIKLKKFINSITY